MALSPHPGEFRAPIFLLHDVVDQYGEGGHGRPYRRHRRLAALRTPTRRRPAAGFRRRGQPPAVAPGHDADRHDQPVHRHPLGLDPGDALRSARRRGHLRLYRRGSASNGWTPEFWSDTAWACASCPHHSRHDSPNCPPAPSPRRHPPGRSESSTPAENSHPRSPRSCGTSDDRPAAIRHGEVTGPAPTSPPTRETVQ